MERKNERGKVAGEVQFFTSPVGQHVICSIYSSSEIVDQIFICFAEELLCGQV